GGRNAGRFDPERGTVRAWLLQIAHFRILNELRRRSRQPEIVPDADGLVLAGIPAGGPGPAEATWQGHRRALPPSALDALPPAQREALRPPFPQELPHPEAPPGRGVTLLTAKRRIRAGLEKLRGKLGPQWAALAALCVAAVLGVRYRSEHATLARYDRALSMVTASDSVNLRMGALPGTPEETHARYRSRPGVGVAVVTFSKFAPAPAGATYQAWVRHAGKWSSLGMVEPDADGNARLIAEDPALSVLPDELEVTVEPRRGSTAPSGRVVVAWAP